MASSRFKTKLSKKQKQRNIQVLLAVIVCSYIFVLWFSYAIGLFDDWTNIENYMLALVLAFFILSLLLAPALLMGIVLGLQMGKAKRVRDNSTFVTIKNIDYYRDNLSELNPSLVSLLIDLDIYGKKDIVATLLRMQNKNAISFQENGKIVTTDKNKNLLDNGERDLLSIIKSGKLSDKKSFAEWKQRRFIDAQSLGYIKTRTEKEILNSHVALGVISFISGILLWGAFLAAELFIVESVLDWAIVFVYLLIMNALIFIPFYLLGRRAAYNIRGDVLWERTPLGNEAAEKIAGLARFMSEFSRLSEAKKEEVALWDDYLVYAIVLEENEQIVNEISKLYGINLRNFDMLK